MAHQKHTHGTPIIYQQSKLVKKLFSKMRVLRKSIPCIQWLRHPVLNDIEQMNHLIYSQSCPKCKSENIKFISYDEEGVWFTCSKCSWNKTFSYVLLKEVGFYNVRPDLAIGWYA